MEITNLPITSVSPSPMNPRKTFDEGDLKELADNIAHQGLLQPITVRPLECSGVSGIYTDLNHGIKYEIVCGERRYRASLLNGAKTIAAIVREMTDDEAFDAMITENLQRKDVDPIEEAYAFGQLIAKGSTAEEVALRFGKSVRFVQDRVKLNSLIPELMLAVKEERLPISAAMVVCKLDEAGQRKFNQQFKDQSVTKQQAQNFVSNLFMNLSRSAWYTRNNGADKDFAGGCGHKCDGCTFNTASHSCLFYEMNATDDKAQCTNREMYDSKVIAYLIEQVEAFKDDLVLKGAPLEFGKCVIIDNYSPGYYSYMEKIHEGVRQALADKGYEITDPSVFGSRNYYPSQDPRLQEKVASGELYKCISFCGEYGSSPDVAQIYYHFKTIVSADSDKGGSVSPQSVEAMKLAEKYKAAKAKGEEKFASWLCDTIGMKYGDEFNTPDTPLTDTEMQLAVVCMMVEIGMAYFDKYGITSPGSDNVYHHVEVNPRQRAKIVRDFMRKVVKNHCMGNGSVYETAKVLAGLWLPEEFKKFTEKHQQAQKKKLGKIADRLKDLGYGTDGKLLEFKDTTHYAQD